MTKVRRLGQKASGRGEYASKEEFVSVFEREKPGLQRLALSLTVNSGTAKRCLIRAFRECIASSSVSKEWVHCWTRRLVIRNAINLVMGPEGVNPNNDADNGLIDFSLGDSRGACAMPEAIFNFPKFERFVFIICVLERYSILDCALLLGKSPRDVFEARQRVGNQAGQIDELNNISQYAAMS